MQLGGQTPLKLAEQIHNNKIPILGTDYQSIDICEDRKRFNKLIKNLKINQPKSDIAYNRFEVKKSIKKIQFPIVIRPSYVLGGRAMRILNNEEDFEKLF